MWSRVTSGYFNNLLSDYTLCPLWSDSDPSPSLRGGSLIIISDRTIDTIGLIDSNTLCADKGVSRSCRLSIGAIRPTWPHDHGHMQTEQVICVYADINNSHAPKTDLMIAPNKYSCSTATQKARRSEETTKLINEADVHFYDVRFNGILSPRKHPQSHPAAWYPFRHPCSVGVSWLDSTTATPKTRIEHRIMSRASGLSWILPLSRFRSLSDIRWFWISEWTVLCSSSRWFDVLKISENLNRSKVTSSDTVWYIINI
jgi:hypothetical protein